MNNVVNDILNKSVSKSEFKEAFVSINNAPEPMKPLPEFDPIVHGYKPILIKQPSFMRNEHCTELIHEQYKTNFKLMQGGKINESTTKEND